MNRSAALIVCLLIAACDSTETPPVEPPPLTPVAGVLTLKPAQLTISPTGTMQFHGFVGDQEIAANKIAWSVADTTLGGVDATGLFSATPCWRTGNTVLQATRIGDPSSIATAPVTMVVPAVALAQIQAISRASDHQPVDLDRVTGAIEVLIQIGAAGCFDVVSVELKIGSSRGDTLVTSKQWSPAAEPPVAVTLPWDTGALSGSAKAFPNGDYFVSAVIHSSTGVAIPTNPVPLRLDNP